MKYKVLQAMYIVTNIYIFVNFCGTVNFHTPFLTPTSFQYRVLA